MFVSIIDRGDLLDNNMRRLTERRLLFALSRFDSRIKRVDLVVNDENGPRGGVDKTCRVTVALHRAADVVITDKHADVIKCISRVAERAGRAVSRAIEKSNELNRLRPAFIDPDAVA